MQHQPFEAIPRLGVERFDEGQAPDAWVPGDFLLTHGDAWTSKIIRFGQRLRIHGDDRKYTHWNHAAMVVSEDGDLIEALGAGVLRTHASKYTPREFHLIHVGGDADDRDQAVRFAEWALDSSYGFLTILSIAYSLVTGGKFTFMFEGQMICSGLVARSLERTGAIFNRTPSHVMPADLAKYFAVEPPGSQA